MKSNILALDIQMSLQSVTVIKFDKRDQKKKRKSVSQLLLSSRTLPKSPPPPPPFMHRQNIRPIFPPITPASPPAVGLLEALFPVVKPVKAWLNEKYRTREGGRHARGKGAPTQKAHQIGFQTPVTPYY